MENLESRGILLLLVNTGVCGKVEKYPKRMKVFLIFECDIAKLEKCLEKVMESHEI